LTGNQFETIVTSTTGSNVITVQATDGASNTRTKQWSVNVSGSADAAFTYDLNGNMLTGAGLTYTWDALDRLKTVSGIGGDPNRTTEFTYDPLGRRIRITEKQGTTTLSDKRYIWIGLKVAEERGWASNTVIKRFYAQGEDRVSGSDAGDYFYTRDHLGSVREVTTGSTATVVARYDYDPYGRRTQTSGTFACDFGFTGHFLHAPSAMCLAPYRAYSPTMGRWLNRDPIEESGGQNLYGFLRNSTLSKIDPYGLEAFYFTIITFIPTDYVEDPFGALYKGDGDPNNTSMYRSTFRTRHKLGFDVDKWNLWEDESAIVMNEKDGNPSVRYRLPNFFEKAFVNYEHSPGTIMYGGQYWLEDARMMADHSAIGYKVARLAPCKIELTMNAKVSDPVAPIGTSLIASVECSTRTGR
jgi:RHS repeat-associated protein